MSALQAIEQLVSPWQAVAIGAGLALAIGATGGAVLAHRLDQAAYAELELKMAQRDQAALAKAIEAAQQARHQADQASTALAIENQKEETAAHAIARTITIHVPVLRECVPLGLVRVLNAAAAGVSVAELNLYPGQSDGACAPVAWDTVAGDVADDYRAARENAEQLNQLIAATRPR